VNPRAVTLLGFAAFALLLATASGHLYSIDGLQYYRVATELVWDGRIVFDPPIVWGDPIVSPITTIGFSLVQVPAVVIARPFWELQPPPSTLPHDFKMLYGDGLYAAVSWVNPALVALTCVVASGLARTLGFGGRLAVVLGFVVVFATPLFFYARADFLQPLVSLLLVGLIAAALRVRAAAGVPPGAITALVALAVATRPPDAVIAIAVGCLTLAVPGPGYRPLGRGWRPMVEIGVGGVIGSVVTAVVNLVRRGAPFDFGYPPNGFSGSLADMVVAELVSPGRGLVWYLPLTLLCAVGGVALWRSGRRLEAAVLAAPLPAYVLFYGFWVGLGGWAWGPRFLVPLAPVVVLLAAGVLVRGTPGPRIGKVAFGVLAAAGFAANIAHLAVDQLRFWAVFGDSAFGTPGFARQFEWKAFAPIGSWTYYDPAVGPDIVWLRAAQSTGGLSVAIGVTLLAIGIALSVAAVRLPPVGQPAAVESE